jgi:hypothetical protein
LVHTARTQGRLPGLPSQEASGRDRSAPQALANFVSPPVFQEGAQWFIAGWSSPVARQAHNLKVTGSNPVPATRQNAARSMTWRHFFASVRRDFEVRGLAARRAARIGEIRRPLRTEGFGRWQNLLPLYRALTPRAQLRGPGWKPIASIACKASFAACGREPRFQREALCGGSRGPAPSQYELPCLE